MAPRAGVFYLFFNAIAPNAIHLENKSLCLNLEQRLVRAGLHLGQDLIDRVATSFRRPVNQVAVRRFQSGHGQVGPGAAFVGLRLQRRHDARILLLEHLDDVLRSLHLGQKFKPGFLKSSWK